ncbi:MAG: cytochrome b/b6 domain-containing protein, partial [Anaerolineales bacterium]
QNLGARHVGGGPAVYSRDGTLLTELVPTPGDPETHVVDPETGESIPWDWGASGVVEMNCFLCHTPNPNNQARIQTLHEGNFHWANTATLVGTGIVEQTDGILHWNQAAFTEGGELRAEFVNIQDPANDNCGLCHGLVHDNVEDPLVMYGCSPERWSTITTGQIISPQRLSDTGMNLANKEELYRPWDVHAERLLKCTDCHYSLNNPLYYKEAESTRPEHLTFDPRRLEIGEYLEKPLHQFARGDSAQSSVAPDLKDTMRHCDSCHSVDTTHEWLPYKTRHMEAISCESCHIPKLFSSANRVQDWTVIHLDGSPRTECRGVEGNHETLSALLIGYEPVLLSRKNVAGKAKLAPYNLITSWFWVYGNPPRPVRLADLKSAYLENGDYHPGVLTRFDRDEDGQLGGMELVLDSSEKEAFIKDRLSRLGLENPRITAEIQPYSINHDIATGEWAIQDCQVCHSEESRVDQPFQLASTTPGGVMPEFVGTHIAAISGEIIDNGNGELYYQPMTDVQKLYVLGHDNVGWVDLGGSLIFVGVLLGVLTHAGLRFYIALRGSEHKSQTESVYMYALYERLWHWLQTFVIVLLLFTGLIIHKPDTFGIFSFRGVVLTHNVLAAILVINAALALFYHLASGEIQQFIPRPRGFFDQAISQALFYLRGIFRGEEHPFEKTPRKKLNPLQQITYFTILNVLLPLQIITGAMMWGAQHWGELANRLGGLPFLAPFHTLIAWLFAAFIVMHVYLTTTGPTPTAGIRAMMMGWDEIETHTSIEEVSQV